MNNTRKTFSPNKHNVMGKTLSQRYKSVFRMLFLMLAWVVMSVPTWADDTGRYELKVVAKPAKAGSFNTNNVTLSAGKTIQLIAYTNSSFIFKEWTDEQGNVVSNQQNFQYTMPTRNVTLTAVYTFKPANPGNPKKNYWDSATGSVIIDDFTAGSLSSAISQAIGSSTSYSKVLDITVAGKINSNDFGIANNYSYCNTLDLSRTTGVNSIPSYAFDYTRLQNILLPSTIESIGYEAFYRCTQLASITCYAIEPPTVGSYAFYGVPSDMIVYVYVPAVSVGMYQEAAGWKDFTILPIQNDIQTLKVSLPQDAKATDFANMYLELTNTKSGQRHHLIMTDKSDYTFSNIIKNTMWNVKLRNERGDVFGEIKNIEVRNENVSVSFAKLKKPQDVSIKVLTAEGTDVTEQTSVTWLTEQNAYLSQSKTLSGIIEDSKLRYNISLSQQLAMQYAAPEQGLYMVKANDNNVVCQLEALPKLVIKGSVIDAVQKTAISNALVTASQMFGGKYGKTISTQTDETGNYTLNVLRVPTTLTLANADYVSQIKECDSLITGSTDTLQVSPTLLRPISGATIAVNFTYRKCTDTTAEKGTQNWYNNYNNIAYTIYNKTKQCAINNISIQYPKIVLLDEVAAGDELAVTVTSKTDDFMPISLTTKVNDNLLASLTFEIVEKGQISASFAKNSNTNVVGMLYNSEGKLMKSYDYKNASLSIKDLSDGVYTLITMGKSDLFNTVYDINQIRNIGLVERNDYVCNSVEVKSGQIASISIDNVPILDESKFYYTSSSTSFMVNKPSVVVGEYLVLSAQLGFKDLYKGDISNVSVVVDLPASCHFVENSVMVGNAVSNYNNNGTQIEIPLSRFTDRVRFCVIPTQGGDYTTSALIKFTYKGKNIVQPIGNVVYTAKNYTITVPKLVANTTIPVSGTTKGVSDIEIYDNSVLIGKTQSLANGSWSTTCTLNEAYNLSSHNIQAKIKTLAGATFLSDVATCQYDENAIIAKTVDMSFYNAYLSSNVYVSFDLINKTTSRNSYMFFHDTDISFTIDLTNNDPSKVKSVTLRVYTAEKEWVTLQASYNQKIDRWIAKGRFGRPSWYNSTNIPIGVKVDVVAETKVNIDASYIKEALTSIPIKLKELKAYKEIIAKNAALFDQILNNNALSQEDFRKFINKQLLAMGVDTVPQIDNSKVISEEEINKLVGEVDVFLKKNIISQLDSLANLDFNDLDKLAPYLNGIEISKVTGLTDSQLLAQGYMTIDKTDNTKVYVLANNGNYDIIDISSGMRIRFNAAAVSASNRLSAKSTDSFVDKMNEGANTIGELCENLKTSVGMFVDAIENIEKSLKASNLLLSSKITDLAADAMWLKYNSNNVILKQLVNAKLKAAVIAKNSNDQIIKWISSNLKQFKVGDVAGKRFGVFAIISDLYDGVTSIQKIVKLYNSCMPCENDLANAKAIQKSLVVLGTQTVAFYIAQLTTDIASLVGAQSGIFAAIPTGGTSLAAVGISVAVVVANVIATEAFSKMFDSKIAIIENSISNLKCKKKNDDDDNDNTPPSPIVTPIHDPSGYVYESVLSNRLEGVKATIYYKEMEEDMYGDLHENVVKWDAEQYAQKNPLFTDENGSYRWDVPEGLWQVKFEKDGYETTSSEWLPVPPPQLDVNIGMKQNVQPYVADAKAYEDAVEVTFSKYMMTEYLNTENVIVMADGKAVDGSIELVDEENGSNNAEQTYASKLRFNAAVPFDCNEVSLVVKNQVRSYANIRMQNDFMQKFAVTKEVKSIECDSLVKVEYGQSGTIDIAVLPAAAAAGKEVEVSLSSNIILSANTTKYTLDANGHASISINGELPGLAAVTFKLANSELSATTLVSVVETSQQSVATPTANIATGTMVEIGTGITLSCKTQGATIYYTLDGSCPCDNTDARHVYDGTPIVINADTEIKAMAYLDGEESEVATFFYKAHMADNIAGVEMHDMSVYPTITKGILNVDISKNANSRFFITDANGRQIVVINNPLQHNTINLSGLSSGMYIVVVRTDERQYVTKVIKL